MSYDKLAEGFYGNKAECNRDNQNIISQMMGDASYLDEGEIKVLCCRKISVIGNRGLTSNEIMAYLFFKMHSQGGYLKAFSNKELSDYAGISPRDVYYVLDVLKKARLIDYRKKGKSCYKDIRIFHSGGPKKHTRFLSLNRTYFRKRPKDEENGWDDYENFKKMSAGAKSVLVYLLFREKFHRNQYDEVVPTTYGNAIEVCVDDIIKITKVQRDTVIGYIREINVVLHDFLSIQPALFGTLHERRLAKLDDKRIVYGAVTSKASRKSLTLLDNDALGFWRSFELWMKSHGYKERPLPCMTISEVDKSAVSLEDRKKINRSNLFTGVISLLKEGIGWGKIYGTFLELIKDGKTFDEYVIAYLIYRLSPRVNETEQISEATG